jgi:hypothetical protein
MHESEEPCTCALMDRGTGGKRHCTSLSCCCESLERLLRALLLLTVGLAAAGRAVANERDLVEAWSTPPL